MWGIGCLPGPGEYTLFKLCTQERSLGHSQELSRHPKQSQYSTWLKPMLHEQANLFSCLSHTKKQKKNKKGCQNPQSVIQEVMDMQENNFQTHFNMQNKQNVITLQHS